MFGSNLALSCWDDANDLMLLPSGENLRFNFLFGKFEKKKKNFGSNLIRTLVMKIDEIEWILMAN